MKYTVLTLFPDLLRPWTEEALIGRAVKNGHLSFDLRDLRGYATGKHRNVDGHALWRRRGHGHPGGHRGAGHCGRAAE